MVVGGNHFGNVPLHRKYCARLLVWVGGPNMPQHCRKGLHFVERKKLNIANGKFFMYNLLCVPRCGGQNDNSNQM